MKSGKLHSLTLIALLALTSTGPVGEVEAACCYFAAKDKDINQPGQKAFINWSPKTKTESFTVQPKFEGNASDFGMVIPTPTRPKLDEMPRDFFKDLAMYTILMPLPEPIYSPLMAIDYMMRTRGAGGAFPMTSMSIRKKGSVRVLEQGVVGSLDYKIIVADDAKGLFDWLKANKYTYSGDEKTLNFYIQKKWFFTVMKIDPKQMKKGNGGSYTGEVTPTRFTFSSNRCIYPLKITQISVKDKTDALFYVQSDNQMDLQGDWSWMHSYRPMYLTYMLGCGIDQTQQQEMQTRTNWLQNKQRKDRNYETTKLEWAKKLGKAELSVLENPKANYGQMGIGDLPTGSKVVSLDYFLKEIKADHIKTHKKLDKYATDQLARLEDKYQPANGILIENNLNNNGKRVYNNTRFTWYPNRKVPLEDIKGLTRLKGHLKQGQWLTKFRKVLRKDEMTSDMVITSVPSDQVQTYVRIMPTSPP